MSKVFFYVLTNDLILVYRKFNKEGDVPTSLAKSLPDTCSLYVITKGKVQNIRPTGQHHPHHEHHHIKATPTKSMRDIVTLLKNTPMVHPHRNLDDAPEDSEDINRYALLILTS